MIKYAVCKITIESRRVMVLKEDGNFGYNIDNAALFSAAEADRIAALQNEPPNSEISIRMRSTLERWAATGSRGEVFCPREDMMSDYGLDLPHELKQMAMSR